MPATNANLVTKRARCVPRNVRGTQGRFRASPPVEELLWLRRQKATRAKLAEGEPIGLADVVSAGAHRHQGSRSRLRVSERDLYLKARWLLAAEIGYARGIGPSQAEDWITGQLAHAI